MKTATAILLTLGTLALTSCATMFQSGPDSVTVTSDPAGAIVRLGGRAIGTTPCTVSVGRRSTGKVTVEKDGYALYQHKLQTAINGTVWLNLFSPWWVGFVIDGISGNFTRWEDGVHVKLAKQDSGS